MSPFVKNQRRSHRRINKRRQKSVVRVWRGSYILVLAVFFMVAYVWQVNSVSVKGFQIFEIEQQIEGLERENQRLQLHVAQMQSSEYVRQQIEDLGMVAEGDTEYITISNDSVAVSR